MFWLVSFPAARVGRKTMDENMSGEATRQIIGKPNKPVVACAVCGEPKGQVRVWDSEGREARLCMRCNSLMNWHSDKNERRFS